jgi:hypothetical protein
VQVAMAHRRIAPFVEVDERLVVHGWPS